MILLGLLDSIKTWMKVTLVVRSKFFFLGASCLTCMVIVSLKASKGFNLFKGIWNDADDPDLPVRRRALQLGFL